MDAILAGQFANRAIALEGLGQFRRQIAATAA
jgi:hypothetical protein